jgi:hypothetical protein
MKRRGQHRVQLLIRDPTDRIAAEDRTGMPSMSGRPVTGGIAHDSTTSHRHHPNDGDLAEGPLINRSSPPSASTTRPRAAPELTQHLLAFARKRCCAAARDRYQYADHRHG